MAINRGDTDTIDVECLASSIEDTMSKYDLFMPPERCIFKTPIALYRHNEKAYIPDAFSIGPLHHGPPDCPKFQATETIKAKYLKGLISRYENPIKQTLKDIINSVNALEGKARKYYAGPVDYSREEFVKILVIDSCFMIELFWRKAQPMEENEDPIFGMSSMVEVLGHDLILLENQVPWMVLEHLFSMMVSPICEMTLMQLAIAFFGSIFALPPTDSARPDLVREIKHIPDLLKKWLVSSIEVGEEEIQLSGWALVPSAMLPVKGITRYSSIEVDKEENSGSDQWELIPSATHLEQAGIKFRMSKSKNMFDIRFANGVLEIPQIIIHEITETFFRNLISFEQCYPKSDHRITSYAILLDNLINTAKDVEILCENKILSNWLNPQDAAGFFNKLYHDTFVKTYYHGKVCREVNKYCGKKLPGWRAVLVRKYFNNPWAGLSTLAAVILLILTLIQTWYSIKS